jgi:predicted RNA binding protein YcfA (HicA-like mRNA interferase family)
MKLPRSVSGTDLVKALKRLGYEVTRQSGSHIRLTCQQTKELHLTIPNHNPIKIGTLAAILTDVSAQLEIPRDDLIHRLFD